MLCFHHEVPSALQVEVAAEDPNVSQLTHPEESLAKWSSEKDKPC